MKRLLLVDDHAIMRESLRAARERELDIKVPREAGEGETALARVRELAPDLVLTDFTMPGIDGIELTQRIMRASPLDSTRKALHQRARLTTILPSMLLMSLVGCATTLTTTVSGVNVTEHQDANMPPGCQQALPRGGCYQLKEGKHHIGYAASGMLVSAAAPAQNADAYLGGTKATGRVSAVYVKVGDGVFVAVNRASARLQESAERWVEIEVNGLPRRDIVTVRGAIDHDAAQVAAGDVVEIKFAHRNNPRYFPMKDETRVTRLVARKSETFAIK